MDVKLAMFTADGTRRDFSLTKDCVVVGRTTSCDLRIPLSSVSRRHCEFRIGSDRTVSLRDLKSSNGTFHNGRRVEKASVKAGDQVRIGPVLFTVVIDGHPETVESTPTVVEESGDVSDHTVSTEGASSHRPSSPRDMASDANQAPADASALAADILAESDRTLPAISDSADLGSADLDASDHDDDSMANLADDSGNIPLAIDEDEKDR